MVSSPNFIDILEVLGASDIRELATGEYWRFFNSTYNTPGGKITSNYLYLLHECPQRIATGENIRKWKALAANDSYTIVTTSKSELSHDITKTCQLFAGKEAYTSRGLLLKNVVDRFVPSIDTFENNIYFVDPDGQPPLMGPV